MVKRIAECEVRGGKIVAKGRGMLRYLSGFAERWGSYKQRFN